MLAVSIQSVLTAIPQHAVDAAFVTDFPVGQSLQSQLIPNLTSGAGEL